MKNFKFFKNDSLQKYILYSIVAILLFILSYKIFSYLTTSKIERTISLVIEDIVSINNRSSDLIKGDELIIDKCLKELPQMREELKLSISKLDINAENLTDEDKAVYSHIYSGGKNNLLIFDQLIAIINNPTGRDIKLACNDLRTYEINTNNDYKNIKFKGSNLSIEDNLSQLINLSIKYCIDKSNLQKIEEINESQINDFNSTMNELIISFKKLKKDYYPLTIDCRNDKLTYELVIKDINDSLLKMKSILNIMESMNVPSNFSYTYEEFFNIVNIYNEYLVETKYSLITEKVWASKKDKSKLELDSLYDKANKLYSNMDISFNKFISKTK